MAAVPDDFDPNCADGPYRLVHRYSDNLKFARSAGIKRGLLTGVSGGSAWFLIFAAYALAFWYGIKLIMDDIERCQGEDPDYCVPEYDPKSMIIVSPLQMDSPKGWSGTLNSLQAAPRFVAGVLLGADGGHPDRAVQPAL